MIPPASTLFHSFHSKPILIHVAIVLSLSLEPYQFKWDKMAMIQWYMQTFCSHAPATLPVGERAGTHWIGHCTATGPTDQ
jgi:hypothetical protein